MYSLVIADDEKWIREGLLSYIEWDKFGITQLYEAENGMKVLDIIANHDVDIIITDIRMPELDGLELISKIKETYPFIKVIIISGYQYFEYAKKAIEYGAFSYILKPINEEELVEQVKKCIEEMEKEREKEQLANNWNKNRSLVYKQMVTGILNHGVQEKQEEIQSKLKLCGIHIERCHVLFFGVLLDSNLRDTLLKQTILQTFEQTINRWIQRQQLDGLAGIIEDDVMYGCFFLKDKHKIVDIRSFFQRVIPIEIEGNSYNATIGLSDILEDMRDWSKGKTQVKSALEKKFFKDDTSLIIPYKEGKKNQVDISEFIESDVEKDIAECIIMNKEGDWKLLLSHIHKKIIQQKETITPEDVKVIHCMLMDKIYYYVFKKQFQAIDQILETDSFKDLCTLTVELLTEWSFKHQENTKESNQVIRIVKEYVKQNYANKITLASCAEHLYLNSCYLSNLFSKQTGEKFTHYLMRVRVDESKNMLADTTLKIYEIAEKVGYSDERYFTKVFKEVEGMTPKEYRHHSMNQIV